MDRESIGNDLESSFGSDSDDSEMVKENQDDDVSSIASLSEYRHRGREHNSKVDLPTVNKMWQQ